MGMYNNIHTLIAENSLATPVWFQSFPTKGMNCPKTSDLKGKKIVKYESSISCASIIND
jgi:hypothetical protein